MSLKPETYFNSVDLAMGEGRLYLGVILDQNTLLTMHFRQMVGNRPEGLVALAIALASMDREDDNSAGEIDFTDANKALLSYYDIELEQGLDKPPSIL